MNKQQLHQVTEQLANDFVGPEIDLWPALQKSLSASNGPQLKREDSMKLSIRFNKVLRTSAISLGVLAALVCLMLFTPQGKVLAQEIAGFFHHAPSDTLPQQTWQMTPLPTDETPTPDPASILDATASVSEVTAQAGFTVYQPASVPEGFTFSGASFDPASSITRLFYQTPDSNALVLKQEPAGQNEPCDLCGEVGASAAIEEVTINGAAGEYVIGVWKLTDNGPVWDSDPYLQTLRWQQGDFAFELLYMGMPDFMDKDLMVSIASSLQ